MGSKAVHGDCTLGVTEDWGKSGNGPASVVFEWVDKRIVSHLSRYRSKSSSDIVGKFLYISFADREWTVAYCFSISFFPPFKSPFRRRLSSSFTHFEMLGMASTGSDGSSAYLS